MIWDVFFVVRSNDSFNFPLGLIKYIIIVIVSWVEFWHPADKWHGPLKRDFLYSKRRWVSSSPCCFLRRPPIARTGRPFVSVLTKYLGIYGLILFILFQVKRGDRKKIIFDQIQKSVTQCKDHIKWILLWLFFTIFQEKRGDRKKTRLDHIQESVTTLM